MSVSHVHSESGESPTPPVIPKLLVPHHPKAHQRAHHQGKLTQTRGDVCFCVGAAEEGTSAAGIDS